MSEGLEQFLASKIREKALLSASEQAVRQGLILPVLGTLGWDRDNVGEVTPEYHVGKGRVDYCLQLKRKERVFVEVKQLDADLSQHQEQLLQYAFKRGVELAALTSGLTWWLYLPLQGGSWEERRFLSVDIERQGPKASAENLVKYLSRDAVASGSAVKAAEELRQSMEVRRTIEGTLPQAWAELCKEPDELLVELLADKVEALCSYRPGEKRVAGFLAGLAVAGEMRPVPATPSGRGRRAPRKAKRAVGAGESVKGKQVVAYSLWEEWHPVNTFAEMLVGVCTQVYQVHRSEFAEEVLAWRGTKRRYFARDTKPIADAQPKLIQGSGIYVSSKLNADAIVRRCRDLLELFGHSADDLKIETSP